MTRLAGDASGPDLGLLARFRPGRTGTTMFLDPSAGRIPVNQRCRKVSSPGRPAGMAVGVAHRTGAARTGLGLAMLGSSVNFRMAVGGACSQHGGSRYLNSWGQVLHTSSG